MTTEQELFTGLFDGQILVTLDGQFRLKLDCDYIDFPRLLIQHCSQSATWHFVKSSFELAIIRGNSWRVYNADTL